jgi:hypothetical protein
MSLSYFPPLTQSPIHWCVWYPPPPPILSSVSFLCTDRYYSGTPVYPFGRGLSYTSCSLSADASTVSISSGTKINVTVTVSNIGVGARAADEVVLAFFVPNPDLIPSDEPAAKLKRQLFDFARVHVAAGQSTKVVFEVCASTLILDFKRALLSSHKHSAPCEHMTVKVLRATCSGMSIAIPSCISYCTTTVATQLVHQLLYNHSSDPTRASAAVQPQQRPNSCISYCTTTAATQLVRRLHAES